MQLAVRVGAEHPIEEVEELGLAMLAVADIGELGGGEQLMQNVLGYSTLSPQAPRSLPAAILMVLFAQHSATLVDEAGAKHYASLGPMP